MQNVEFKCELRDPELASAVCSRIKAVHIGRLEQTDTYYRVPSGTLKRRECKSEPVEWIAYERDAIARPRLSLFTIYSDSEARMRFGERPLPVWVVVRKRRDLWIKRAVRIHLDEVEGLGWFFELEALVSRRQTVARCHEAIGRLRKLFGPSLGEPVSTGYAELLLSAQGLPSL